MLLAFAGLLLAEPDVLLLDEPTNNLDRGARRLLIEAVRHWRRPLIMVSHDRELLETVDHIAELREGALRLFGGSFSAYVEALAVEQQAAQRAVRTAEGDLKRQRRELAEMRIKLDRRQRYAKAQAANVPPIVAGAKKRAAQVSAGKLKGGHEADVAEARGRLEQAEELVRDDDVIRIDLRRTAVPAGRDVLLLSDVVLRNLVRVEAHLRGPDRVAVVGPNGSGKTTLIDTITGTIPAVAGRVDLRVPVRVLPQRLTVLDDAETVLTGVSRLAPSADDNTLRAELARFLLDADTVVRPVGILVRRRTLPGQLGRAAAGRARPAAADPGRADQQPRPGQRGPAHRGPERVPGRPPGHQPRRTLPRRPRPDRPPRPQHLTRHSHPDHLTRLRGCWSPRGVGLGCRLRGCSNPRGVG